MRYLDASAFISRFDELITSTDCQMKDYSVENTWTITVCTEMQKMKVVLCMTNFTLNIYSNTIQVQQQRHPSTYIIQFLNSSSLI